jgi:microcystin-dependent protein
LAVFRPFRQRLACDGSLRSMPTAFDRQYNFANYQLLNPTTPLVGSQVDAEFNAAKIALDSVASDLGLIQKDDGTLQNGIVRPQHLASDFVTGLATPVAWESPANYVVDDTVFHEAKLYICLVSHLSGVFATDLAADKWDLIADFASAVDSAINISFTPGSGIAAENVQDAITEVRADALAADAAISDVLDETIAAFSASGILVKTASDDLTAERVVTDNASIKADWATAGQVKFEFANTVVAKIADFSIAATDKNKLFLVTTASAEVTATLPTLTNDDAGWTCEVMKTNAGTNAMFIAPASGTLQSGAYASLAKARRCIPGKPTRILWTGSAWILTRAVGVALGACIDLTTASLPVGYEWPNGQTLSSGSTKYPEFYAENGSSAVVRDARGRVVAGKDDMGGSSANRLTNQSGGLDGDTLGAAGGSETHTITATQMAAHTHSFSATTSSDGAHTHTTGVVMHNSGAAVIQPDVGDGWEPATVTSSSNGAHTHTVSGTSGSAGSDGAHNNVQPTIVMNKILVVE